MSWRELPDILAVGLLIYAFVSVARPDRGGTTRLWLIGWLSIELHFFAYSFLDAPAPFGLLADILGTASLTWCALLFMLSMDPAGRSPASRWVFWGLCVAHTLTFLLHDLPAPPLWAWLLSDSLYAVVPVSALLIWPQSRGDRVHAITGGLFCAESVLLLACQFLPQGATISEIAPLTGVYLAACAAVWCGRPVRSAGFIVTVIGLFAWSQVFSVGAAFEIFLPRVHVDAEVWNLPKYLVAVGMILLLLEDQLRDNLHMAQHDLLTGLPNRRAFQERLDGALERARRKSATAALLVIDLDGFKAVNDSCGHHVGDEVLQQVANLLLTRIRRSDTLARLGGDEFAVILESPTNQVEAHQVREDLEALMDVPFIVHDRRMKLGASIGVAVFPAEAQDPEALSILADQRMYAAKRQRAHADGVPAPQVAVSA